MAQFRRYPQAGATIFFTVTLRDRRQTWLVDHIDNLREATQSVQHERPFDIIAAVILPDHLHMIWMLPPDDADFSTRWQQIKTRFTRTSGLHPKQRQSERDRSERGIWQRRFFDHVIRDEDDLQAHLDYIHFNPVKHGFVRRPVDWPHSSIHQFIRKGRMDARWGTGNPVVDLDLD